MTPRFENKEARNPKGFQAVISNSKYEHLNPYTLVMLCRWVHPLPNFRDHFIGSKDKTLQEETNFSVM